MWLFSTSGFYSIVEKPKGSFQIRARVKADLRNLVREMKWKHPIIDTPFADYAYRVIVPKAEMIAAVTHLAEQIGYANYKDAIHHIPSQRPRSGTYTQVWALIQRLQR